MKILVACIGNVFLGDDGFGPAIAERLCTRAWPAGVEVIDFGIRGIDLGLALTSGFDAAILVDAVARGGAPGTLYVIEPQAGAPAELSTHALDPASVLAIAVSLGVPPARVWLVGCEPASLGEGLDVVVGLSEPVRRSLEPAERLVRELVEAACTS